MMSPLLVAGSGLKASLVDHASSTNKSTGAVNNNLGVSCYHDCF